MERTRVRNSTTGSDMAVGIATLGAVAAGAAIFEVALVPAILVGGAAMLAPDLISKDIWKRVSGGLRRLAGIAASDEPKGRPVPGEAASFDVWRAVIKTVTYRVALTTVDFGANYFVIGELATAAGLSGLSLVAGPIFYFAHEAAWHHYGSGSAQQIGEIHVHADAHRSAPSQALGKTITYEAVTAVSEFGVNYFVLRDFAAAAGLAAFSVVISPFVYFAHEKAWEYYDATKTRPADAMRVINPKTAIAAPQI